MSVLDLFRPKWNHSEVDVRIAAIERIDDPILLMQIADADPTPRVRALVKERLRDQTRIVKWFQAGLDEREPHKAISILTVVIQRGEISPLEKTRALIARAKHLATFKRDKEAIKDLSEAIDCYPVGDAQEAAMAYHRRGTLHLRAKNYEHAICDFTHAISLKQDLADAYFYRGLACGGFNKSHPEKSEWGLLAQADLEEASYLNPTHRDLVQGLKAISGAPHGRPSLSYLTLDCTGCSARYKIASDSVAITLEYALRNTEIITIHVPDSTGRNPTKI